jgi:hypothetical protein
MNIKSPLPTHSSNNVCLLCTLDSKPRLAISLLFLPVLLFCSFFPSSYFISSFLLHPYMYPPYTSPLYITPSHLPSPAHPSVISQLRLTLRSTLP